MDMPTYDEFINPILQALREGGGSLTQVEMVDAVERIMHLPEAVIERRHARYSMIREFDYRLAWAQAYLKKMGYLTRSTRGVWVLTSEGNAIEAVEALVDLDADDIPGDEERSPKWKRHSVQQALSDAMRRNALAEAIRDGDRLSTWSMGKNWCHS